MTQETIDYYLELFFKILFGTIAGSVTYWATDWNGWVAVIAASYFAGKPIEENKE